MHFSRLDHDFFRAGEQLCSQPADDFADLDEAGVAPAPSTRIGSRVRDQLSRLSSALRGALSREDRS